jgi:hypothetical protein
MTGLGAAVAVAAWPLAARAEQPVPVIGFSLHQFDLAQEPPSNWLRLGLNIPLTCA